MSAAYYEVLVFVTHKEGDKTGTGTSVDLIANSPARAREAAILQARTKFPDAYKITVNKIDRLGLVSKNKLP